MQTVAMDLAIHNALRFVNSTAPRAPGAATPSFIARLYLFKLSIFVAPGMNRDALKLADDCSRLEMYALKISQNEDANLIDPEMSLRNTLEELKVSLTRSRKSLLGIIETIEKLCIPNTRIEKAVKTHIALNAEMYDAANQLQWEIAEHDASYSKHHDGFVASNADDLDAMLSRIASGA